jgi:hypothetical protein
MSMLRKIMNTSEKSAARAREGGAATAARLLHDMVDYSKWELIEDDEDETPQRPTATSAPARASARPAPSLEERQANHDQSMALIAEWVAEADPRLSSDERTRLMHFLKVQHKGVHPDNVVRHLEITAFMERAEVDGQEPASLHALLALAHLCKRRSEDADRDVAAQGNRVLVAVMGALNTLWAAKLEGGARTLFDKLLKEPQGELARRYREMEFALDVVRFASYH